MSSYLKFLSRNKLYATIEFAGLAVSMAFVILIGTYVRGQLQVAKGYPEWKETYAVGVLNYDRVAVGPRSGLASLLKDNIPEIEKASIISNRAVGGKIGDVTLHYSEGSINVVNPDFLDMFPIRWVAGDPSALVGQQSVAVSERFALEKFPEGDVLGKHWEINGKSMTVAAIFKDLGTPLFRMEGLCLLEVRTDTELTSGAQGGTTCLICSSEPEEKLTADIDAVLEKHYRLEWNRDESRAMKNGCIERLDKLYFSDLNEGSYALMKGNRSLLRMLAVVVLLLLLSAIFNYINLSTALAGRRVKEMATRSVLGASREQVLWAFLKESLAFTAASTAAAILLACAFRPVLSSLVDAHLGSEAVSVPFAWNWDFTMVAAILGLVLITGLMAGWIPFRIASRFDIIQVIKGDYRTESKRVLSKIFIVLQTALSVAMISLSIVMERQYSHMIHYPLGADVDGLYQQYLVSGSGHEDALRALPFVKEIGRNNGYPGHPYMKTSLPGPETGDKKGVSFIQCDPEAFDMFGFEIVEDFHAPSGLGSWFSESAFRSFGIDPDNPSLPSFLQGYLQDPIAGVIRDFALSDAAHITDDFLGIVSVEDPLSTPYRVLRIDGNRKEAEAVLKELYRRFSIEMSGYEGIPGLSGFIKDKLDDGLAEAEDYMRLFELFMFLAVMVSLLGLLAMSALYAGEKTHDVAVRKVFGSTVRGEVLKGLREYLLMVGIACVIAVPVAVWLAERYLEDFRYRISGYGWIFAVAVAIAIIISVASVLWQTLGAARTNPAQELKKE